MYLIYSKINNAEEFIKYFKDFPNIILRYKKFKRMIFHKNNY